ncbi:hypothetical protein [Desulfallas thermosapovorans]|uniref:Uncharacterized protein n=1 Tax=Desulfallas thermosapovorans DSM 6562 TaxID=1121431 RepID=A0A5S4ZQC5_9FIRM|nr:hypothetical protein [Desulfallas thermosapovorans]TYO94882.1 hypothetical protein LX24_02136 [Desulfallas thermosapovorans DSM 6562]
MKIELEPEEINCLMNALNMARYCYEKLNQIDRAAEAQQVHDLLNSAREIHAHVHMEHMTEFGRQEYREILRKREARLKGDGKVVELYQFAPVDEDDPNEVSADREIGRIAREWAREMKDNDK